MSETPKGQCHEEGDMGLINQTSPLGPDVGYDTFLKWIAVPQILQSVLPTVALEVFFKK